jgi:hypothetical protein
MIREHLVTGAHFYRNRSGHCVYRLANRKVLLLSCIEPPFQLQDLHSKPITGGMSNILIEVSFV